MKNRASILTFILSILFVVSSNGCDESIPPRADMELSLMLTDVDGHPRSAVRTGEDFILKLSVTNRTGIEQYFNYAEPEFLFVIKQNDSVLMTSVEGYADNKYLQTGVLQPDSSRTEEWLAPRSPKRPTFVLSPGRYEVDGSMIVFWIGGDYLTTTKKYFIITP